MFGLSYAWIDALRIAGTVVAVLAVVALAFMPTLPPSREQATGGVVPLVIVLMDALAGVTLWRTSSAPVLLVASGIVGGAIAWFALGVLTAIGLCIVVLHVAQFLHRRHHAY